MKWILRNRWAIVGGFLVGIIAGVATPIGIVLLPVGIFIGHVLDTNRKPPPD